MSTHLLSFILVATGILCTVAPSTVEAQRAGSFSVLRFRPGATPLGLLHTDSAKVLGHFNASAGLYVHYDHKPLTFVDARTGDTAYDEVSYQFNTQLVAAIGLYDRFEVGLAVPVAILQGTGDVPSAFPDVPAIGGGVGDIRLILKAQLYSTEKFTLGVVLPILLPTGNADNYLGDGGTGVEPRLAASYNFGRLKLAANLAYRLRPDNSFSPALTSQSIAVNDEFAGYFGGRFAVVPTKLDVIVDWYGALNLDGQDNTERGGEILAGARAYFPGGWVATLAAGPGLGQGMGVPAFRVLASVAWMPVPDSDKDGLKDPADNCPREPEDKDGFEDADGCPDPDNDEDGVPDVKDKCPDTPEDKDGFQDQDGCPDPDNDKDGIPDIKDKCPNKPEDKDGFQDKDGCPDPDNDKDGIPDVKDKCPNKPEGPKDGWRDEDGCPDPDNDKDGILDEKDKCPNEPESFNKYKDDDGCPDVAPKRRVRIVSNTIAVPPVFFATNKDVILKRSYKDLNAVVEVLRMNKWIKKIRIEGHTDDVGKDSSNMNLSERRAKSVFKFLSAGGVAEGRLSYKGFGETTPKCPFKDLLKQSKRGKRRARRKAKKALKACRSTNRRVVFRILDPKAEGNTVTRTRKVVDEEPGKTMKGTKPKPTK